MPADLTDGPQRLAEVLRTGSLGHPADGTGEELVELATRERVPGLLMAAAGGQLGGRARQDLQAACRCVVANHLTGLAAVESVGAVLDDAAIPWVVVKGPVLAELAYQGIPRPYDDLDLLVSSGDFSQAVEALEGWGAVLQDRNWPVLQREGRAELHLGHPALRRQFDLHWHLVNHGWMRHSSKLPTSEVLERRVHVPELQAPVLDPTDRVVHYALHGLVSGGHHLIWMADLDRAVRNDPPDWDLLVERCRRWKLTLPVAVMLARTESVLDAPIPAELVDRLADGPLQPHIASWLRSWRTAGRLPGGGSVSGAVTRGLADSLTRTSANVIRLAAGTARRLVDRYPHWLDPDDPAHPLHEAGGDRGRASYLAAVGSQDRYGHRRMTRSRTC